MQAKAQHMWLSLKGHLWHIGCTLKPLSYFHSRQFADNYPVGKVVNFQIQVFVSHNAPHVSTSSGSFYFELVSFCEGHYEFQKISRKEKTTIFLNHHIKVKEEFSYFSDLVVIQVFLVDFRIFLFEFMNVNSISRTGRPWI